MTDGDVVPEAEAGVAAVVMLRAICGAAQSAIKLRFAISKSANFCPKLDPNPSLALILILIPQ